jgi:uncharacterized protein (DUF2147 family)
MKKGSYLLILILVTFTSNAQSIIGKWKSIDSNSQKEMAIIEIYQKDNKYYAKLKEILNVNKSHAECKECAAKIKNKSLLGKLIIKDLVKSTIDYNSGILIDPFSDKQYNCEIKFIGENKLKVRAFTGFYLFGKTQYWVRF